MGLWCQGRARWSGVKNGGGGALFFSYHHFHANVAINAVHKDVAKNGLWAKIVFCTMNIKKEGITIHQGNGLGHPLLPTEKVGGRLLRTISPRRKGFWFGGLGQSWSRRVRPVMAREWALETFVWNIWESSRRDIRQDQVSFACDLRAVVRGSHGCSIDERRVFVLWPQYKL